MKVVAVNIAEPKEIELNGRKRFTGIFKKEVTEIELGFEDVVGDTVSDRKFHGGRNKACYVYGQNHYNYWKSLYPDLNWETGMFGENITIENFNETNIKIGNQYKLGTALVEISEHREPCTTLGHKFGTNKIIKQFANTTFCGAYLKVIETGIVKKNDELILIKESKNETVAEAFKKAMNKK